MAVGVDLPIEEAKGLVVGRCELTRGAARNLGIVSVHQEPALVELPRTDAPARVLAANNVAHAVIVSLFGIAARRGLRDRTIPSVIGHA